MKKELISTDPTATQIVLALTSFDEQQNVLELIDRILIGCLLDPDEHFGQQGRSEVCGFLTELKAIHRDAYKVKDHLKALDFEETERAAKSLTGEESPQSDVGCPST